MTDRRLLRLDPDGPREVADLSGLASHPCNDMAVDARGRAYIGHFGYDFEAGGPPAPASLILVHPDGRVEVAAEDLSFPNGAAIAPDGATLIVGESMAARLTAFDVASDGSLANRRVWAQLSGGAVPDGIGLDAEGAIWVASPSTSEVLRVAEGGEVLARVPTERMAIACMLGGADRRTLFVLTAPAVAREECLAQLGARIETVAVEVPGAGYP